MKAEELRIGNYVNYNDGSRHDDVRRIVGIDRTSVTSIVKGCRLATAIRSNDLIYPIPLSEEVLLKAGFKNGGYDLLFWYNDDIELYGFNHLDTDNYVLLTSHLKEDVNVRVYYLHQLQNLYYALTGEELEVKWG